MSMTDNDREQAARLGGALFIAGLYSARAMCGRESYTDMSESAIQGALRALLSMELGDRANVAAEAIITAGRTRCALEGDTVHAKGLRVTLALLSRVDWSAQRPLTLALVIDAGSSGAFVVRLDDQEGPLYRKRIVGETPKACAERLRLETLGTIGEVTSPT